MNTPEFADVIGRAVASRHQASSALDKLIAHGHDLRVGQRLAELVGDRAGEDAGTDEAEVDVVKSLTVRHVDREQTQARRAAGMPLAYR